MIHKSGPWSSKIILFPIISNQYIPERCPPTGCEKSSGEAGGAAGGPQEECQNLLVSVSGGFCSQFMFGPGRTR